METVRAVIYIVIQRPTLPPFETIIIVIPGARSRGLAPRRKEPVARREDKCLRNRCRSAPVRERGWGDEVCSQAASRRSCFGRCPARAAEAVRVGLNPLFLDSDIRLLSMLETYLAARLGRPVQLIKRRTYQEITAMLLWGNSTPRGSATTLTCSTRTNSLCCGSALSERAALPDLCHRQRGEQSSVVRRCRRQRNAFSDPDSTSGYLVTRYLLALRRTTPEQFFRTSSSPTGTGRVRAVASGLAESGSMDGYVWDVMRVASRN